LIRLDDSDRPNEGKCQMAIRGSWMLYSADDAPTFLRGTSKNDELLGSNGDDILVGRGGDDILVGYLGVDRLVGGQGRDIFSFTAPFEGARETARDTIVDFEKGSDAIDVTNWGSNFSYIGGDAFSGPGTAELRSIFNSAATIVFGDADGNGSADFSFRILGHVDLTVADFAGQPV
jgi:serralysin